MMNFIRICANELYSFHLFLLNTSIHVIIFIKSWYNIEKNHLIDIKDDFDYKMVAPELLFFFYNATFIACR
jgi:demethoxyubiquinone hydroxylase (CLK1/Coq7/Cat5 family)